MSSNKSCDVCSHWSKHICLDSKGNPISREAKLAPEPAWTYEVCAKNWGLPQMAYLSALNCNFYKERK